MLNLFIFLACGVGLLVFLKRFTGKEIIDPLFLAPAYWIIFITFSIFFSVYYNLYFYWSGIIPIGLLLFSFISGSIVFKYIQHVVSPSNMVTQNEPPKHVAFSLLRLRFIIFIFSFLGLSAVIIQLQYLDIHIENIKDVFYAANQISLIRYAGGVDMPKYGLFLMAFLYSAGFLGGIYYGISKGWANKIFSLLPFSVIIIFTIINSAKAGLLFLTVIWISGYFSIYVYKKQGEIKNAGKLIIRACVISVILICSIPITLALRGGNMNSDINLVSHRTLSYFGSFNAFSIWYDSYKHDRITGTKYTFSGINNFFENNREQGLYGTNNAEIGKYDNVPIQTNVYTMARGLIEDFTLFGAMTIMLFVGFVIQYLYLQVKKRKIWPMSFLALFYSVLLMCFTLNILNYNTIFFSWIISILILGFVKTDNTTPFPSIN